MTNLDGFASAFGFDAKEPLDYHFYGKIYSIASNGSYNVISGYSYDAENGTYAAATTSCAPFCRASVGDVVLVCVFDGTAVAVSKKGGDDPDAQYVKRQPSGTSELPHDTITTNGYPIVLSDTFANNGQISYMTAAEFRTLIDAPSLSASNTWTASQQQNFSGNKNWSHKDTVVDLLQSNNGLSSGTRYHEWLSYDKNGYIPGGVSNEVASGGSVTTRLRCRNYDTSGNAYDNPLVLSVTKTGAKSASLGCDFTLTNSGRLYMNHGTVDTAESGNNVSDTTYLAYGVRDRDSRFYQYTQAVAYANGGTRAQFAARNNVNGSSVDNIIYLDVSATGELSVTLSANARASWLEQVMKGKTVLYNNAAGSATSVTLSSSAANFNHMRIYYSSNTAANATSYTAGGVSSVDVYSPNGKYVDLVGAHRISDTCLQIRAATAYINGTTITVNSQGMYANVNNNAASSVGKEAKTYIYRVEAWNE